MFVKPWVIFLVAGLLAVTCTAPEEEDTPSGSSLFMRGLDWVTAVLFVTDLEMSFTTHKKQPAQGDI
jgi:hypothetical protein